MKRSSLREQIFKLLFRAEFNDAAEMPEQEEMFFDSGDLTTTEKDRQYITTKCNRILKMTPQLDKELSDRMTGWTLDRIGMVEKAVLRLGLYEIEYDDDVPAGVAISEAVELAKKFGEENSGAFVNGILARFVQKTGSTGGHSAADKSTKELKPEQKQSKG